jgi:PAS domain S-box-containing protein
MPRAVLGIDPADAVPLEQPRQRRLAQARRLGRGRRHGPQRQDPLGRDVVGELQQLRIVAPELLADAVAQAHALLLQLLGQARPLAQLDHGRVAGLHGPEQVRVGAQPGGRDPGVAAVVLGAGDAEPVAQAVELLGVDRVHGEAAVQQRIHHRPVRHLDRHRDGAGIARDRHQPVAECRQARAAMRERPLAHDGAAAVEDAGLVLRGTPVNRGEPAHGVIGHGPCAPVSHEPPRRLPEPVSALGGATSYWASVVASLPGHRSNAGAHGTSAGLLRWDELTPPEWMPQTLRGLEELKATGQGTPFEKEYLRKDGSRWWGLFAGRMLDGGTAVELVLDVTDRKAAEQALRDGEARLRSLVEGIPQLVFRSRSSGERIWGSPQWIAYAGQSEEESVGLGWLDAVHPDDRAATMAAWAGAEARGLFSVEHRTFHAADGTWRWFQSRAAPVRDAAGGIEWFGTSTDVDDQVRAREVLARGREELEARVAERTAELRQALDSLRAEMAQRERAEEQLRQAQKMEAVGQLTGGIAHDFNNMLQGVAGGLDMARRRTVEGRAAEALRFLDLARQSVSRAAGLTRRLLAFARRQRLEPKPVDADALVAGMADLIRRTVGPAVRLELRLRDGRARVLCDPGELESALLNLCINARDAMPDGGQLTIGTEDVRLSASDASGLEGLVLRNYVEISVADTGRGMPAEVVERAFEPFFTTKPLGHGTGLGLSQVYGFVRQSGGMVRLESAPGRGTTVRICLPQREQGGAWPRAPGAAPAPDEDVHAHAVLLVDDEEVAREAMAERLRELGYRVLEAADGPAALHALDGGARVDMLVTDVGLPNGMNGPPGRRGGAGAAARDTAAVHHRLRGHRTPAGERGDRQALRPRRPRTAGPGSFGEALKAGGPRTGMRRRGALRWGAGELRRELAGDLALAVHDRRPGRPHRQPGVQRLGQQLPATVSARATGRSTHHRVEQKRRDILDAIVRGLRAANRHHERHGRVDLPVALLGREQVAAPVLLAHHVADAPPEHRVAVVPQPAGPHRRVQLDDGGR